jgi:magnesium chelatase family protein
MADVKGQALAKRALEIVAAGGHNLLFIGPPGVGKSMLARRLLGILPDMTEGEALEVTRIHSLCGCAPEPGIVSRRPFRAPHHSASYAALVGGGPFARPGEVSLAHGGVLFLDELAEFNRPALEALRQPIEEFRIVVARARDTVEYPARFILVAATNPCPCGWRGHPQRRCLCTPAAIGRYMARLSGPLLDRIDIHAEMSPVPFEAWAADGAVAAAGESSERIMSRVVGARAIQRKRFATKDFAVNAYIPSRELRRHCGLETAGLRLLEGASRKKGLSARSLDRMLRVARTIADLDSSPTVCVRHLAEAMQYRGLERLSL